MEGHIPRPRACVWSPYIARIHFKVLLRQTSILRIRERERERHKGRVGEGECEEMKSTSLTCATCRLRLNHVGHHVASGKANYNVCCPGMDHILGTYMSEEEWTPKIRVREAKPIEGALASANM